jgi:hypothetical protein
MAMAKASILGSFLTLPVLVWVRFDEDQRLDGESHQMTLPGFQSFNVSYS